MLSLAMLEQNRVSSRQGRLGCDKNKACFTFVVAVRQYGGKVEKSKQSHVSFMLMLIPCAH